MNYKLRITGPQPPQNDWLMGPEPPGEEEFILGIDEAGRGCVIGPMVLAGVFLRAGESHTLVQLGVADSKLLSPKRRENLSQAMIETLHLAHRLISLEPATIDHYCFAHRLNVLEAETSAQIIRHFRPAVAYLDALGPGGGKYRGQICQLVQGLSTRIIAENHADRRYPIVSAASILAKVARDRAVAILREQWGDFGSGYPADPKTICFLRNHLKEEGTLPPCVRRSWKTVAQRMTPRQSLFQEEYLGEPPEKK